MCEGSPGRCWLRPARWTRRASDLAEPTCTTCSTFWKSTPRSSDASGPSGPWIADDRNGAIVRLAVGFIYMLSGIHIPFAHGLALTLLVWNSPDASNTGLAREGRFK